MACCAADYSNRLSNKSLLHPQSPSLPIFGISGVWQSRDGNGLSHHTELLNGSSETYGRRHRHYVHVSYSHMGGCGGGAVPALLPSGPCAQVNPLFRAICSICIFACRLAWLEDWVHTWLRRFPGLKVKLLVEICLPLLLGWPDRCLVAAFPTLCTT